MFTPGDQRPERHTRGALPRPTGGTTGAPGPQSRVLGPKPIVWPRRAGPEPRGRAKHAGETSPGAGRDQGEAEEDTTGTVSYEKKEGILWENEHNCYSSIFCLKHFLWHPES